MAAPAEEEEAFESYDSVFLFLNNSVQGSFAMLQMSFDAFWLPCACPGRSFEARGHERSYAISSPSAALQPASLQAKSQKDATKDSEVYKKLFTKDDRRNAFVFAFGGTDKLHDRAVHIDARQRSFPGPRRPGRRRRRFGC